MTTREEALKDLQKKNLEKAPIEQVLKELRESNHPLLVLNHVSKRLVYVQGEILNEILLDRVTDIAETFKRTSDKFDFIGEIGHYPYIMEHELVIEAFSYVIRTNEHAIGFIHELRYFPRVLCHPMIIKEVLKWIEGGNELWGILATLGEFSCYKDDDIIHQAIIEDILKSEDFISLISSILAIKAYADNIEIQNAIKKRIGDIPGNIEKDIHYWDAIVELGSFPWIVEDKRVVEGISKAINSSPNKLRVLFRVCQLPTLHGCPSIQEAIAREIAQSGEPWNIIGKIKPHRVLVESNAIAESIQSRIPDIVAGLSSDPRPWMIIGAISHYPGISDDDSINTVIKTRLEFIRAYLKEISDGYGVNNIFDNIADCNVFFEDEEIRKALVLSIRKRGSTANRFGGLNKHESLLADDIFIDLIIEMLESASDIRDALFNVSDIPEVIEHPRIARFIKKNLKEITDIFSDETKEYFYDDIDVLLDIERYIEREELMELIVKAIRESSGPWFTIGSVHFALPSLYEEARIQEAIKERIPEFVIILEKGISHWGDLLHYYDMPPFFQDERIIEAIRGKIDEFALEIHEGKGMIYVLEPLASIDIIRDSKPFKEAISYRARDIAHHIKLGNHAYTLLHQFSNLLFLLENDDVLDAIIFHFEHTSEPWLIGSLEVINKLLVHEDIKTVLIERIPDILHELMICPNKDVKIRIEDINNVPVWVDHPSIQKVIAHRT